VREGGARGGGERGGGERGEARGQEASREEASGEEARREEARGDRRRRAGRMRACKEYSIIEKTIMTQNEQGEYQTLILKQKHYLSSIQELKSSKDEVVEEVFTPASGRSPHSSLSSPQVSVDSPRICFSPLRIKDSIEEEDETGHVIHRCTFAFFSLGGLLSTCTNIQTFKTSNM
jgi:hypothetical protein